MSGVDRRAWRRFLVAQLWLLAVVGVIFLAVIEFRDRGTTGISGSVTVANHVATGQEQDIPAPSFSIEGLDGGTVSLEAFRGEVVVLNFWATWCTPCREEAPAFQRLSREYDGHGVQFVGMNERDDRAAAQDFLREFRLEYPSGFDPTGSLADDFELYGMPTTFLIDADGIIRERFIGYLTEDTLRPAIEHLLGKGT
jgi:cytochrome c biogenesis protein CcmG, thiol:disulfide interchange protein DsbE